MTKMWLLLQSRRVVTEARIAYAAGRKRIASHLLAIARLLISIAKDSDNPRDPNKYEGRDRIGGTNRD